MGQTKHQRVLEQSSFILHRYAYRETSLIVEAFTRDYGRIALIAKGAKRPHSPLRLTLQSFSPIALSWSGKAELRTLVRADWVGGMSPLLGKSLLYGFYLNELLLKFCAREDPHEKLFEHYTHALACLARGDPIAPILRRFEYALLVEVGYAAALNWCVDTNAPVQPEEKYVYHPERGICLATTMAPSSWPILSGQSLLDISSHHYGNISTARYSKVLMNFLLQHHLQKEALVTREILIALHQQ